jgi:hypothetical protein
MRPSFALRALSLAIGLSAFSLSGHAAIQFTCSDALTSEAGEALVMRCSGVLDVRGDGASDPDSVLNNAVGISLHGELGLSLDRLTLVSPNIVLTVGQGQLQLGNELVVDIRGDVHVGLPPRVQLGQGGTRQDAVLRPNASGTVTVNGSGSGNLVFSPVEVVPADGIGQQQGGSIVVGGGIIVTEDNSPLLVPQVGQVPEPGTCALALVGLGALSLRLRRRG